MTDSKIAAAGNALASPEGTSSNIPEQPAVAPPVLTLDQSARLRVCCDQLIAFCDETGLRLAISIQGLDPTSAWDAYPDGFERTISPGEHLPGPFTTWIAAEDRVSLHTSNPWGRRS